MILISVWETGAGGPATRTWTNNDVLTGATGGVVTIAFFHMIYTRSVGLKSPKIRIQSATTATLLKSALRHIFQYQK
jgi:hypothetical protein